jgi:Putative bacterial sensory transduction regulator
VSAVDLIERYVGRLPGETRRLADAEWGITVAPEQARGWPLDVGVRVADGLVRVQAFALPADDAINPWNFLHWNRGTRYIRFACTRAGDIWVHADLPVPAVDERQLDRVLGLVVEGAVAARDAVSAQRAEVAGPEVGGGEAAPGGWGALG